MRDFDRGNRRDFGGDRGGSRGPPRGGPREPREEHKATCSECGQECTVPFKPAEGRPVFCGECWKAKRPPRREF